MVRRRGRRTPCAAVAANFGRARLARPTRSAAVHHGRQARPGGVRAAASCMRDDRGRSRGDVEIPCRVVPQEVEGEMVPPFASVSVPIFPLPVSEKWEKTQSPASSTLSVAAKSAIFAAKPSGSRRSSVPPTPVKPTVWPPPTVESNSRVEAPEIVSVPFPLTAPSRSSAPEETTTVPLLSTVRVVACSASDSLLEQTRVGDERPTWSCRARSRCRRGCPSFPSRRS